MNQCYTECTYSSLVINQHLYSIAVFNQQAVMNQCTYSIA
jgi:hypothetical protein